MKYLLNKRLAKFKQKETTDWWLINQSLRRRTDEEIIRLCDIEYAIPLPIAK